MAATNLINPFPGLKPFGAEEDYLFFGREEQTRELLQLLRAHRFLAVVGTSGSGKSSLVRAGLLPALYGGTMVGAGSDWSTVVFRPGGDPLLNLAEQMVQADLYDPEDDEAPLRIRATLSRSRLGLVQSVKQSDLPEGTNLLIVVDQFEELFRFRDTSPEHQGRAIAFVKLLLNAVADPKLPIYVAMTMRSDYLGDCARLPGLAEAVNDGEYLIPKLTRDQKRAAIEKPIAVGGGQVSPALVQQLLNDVGDDSDQLPILQHVLMRIWDKWKVDHNDDEPIDLRHYDLVGGMGNALSLHADEVYDKLPDDNSRQLAMRVFQAITERGDDERGTRRPTRLDQLCSIVDGTQDDVAVVLDAYRRAGRTFVMPMQDVELQPETVIDISHESLMRVWQRLRGWVAEESQAVRIYRRLAETAALHVDGHAGVYRNPDLQIASSWRDSSEPTKTWGHRYHDGFDVAMAFLDKSWTTAHAEEEAREATRQRELEQAKRLADSERQRAEVESRAKKRLYVLLVGISAALLVAVGMYFYAEQQRGLAETNRKEAVTNAATANKNERRATQNAVTAERNAEEAKRQETVARKNADEATRQANLAKRNAEEAKRQETVARKNADEATRQANLAETARAETRKGLYRSQILIAHQGLVQQEGLDQVSRTLDNWRPKADEDDLRGWEWYYLNSLRSTDQQFISTGSTFQGAADWGPSGKLIAYGAGDFSIVLYDVKNGREVKRLVGHTQRLTGIQFSRDGKLLVSGSRDNTARVWDVALGLEQQVFTGHTNWVHTVDFSPDNSRIISSSFDSTARIWEVKTGKLLNEFSTTFNALASSQWSPSGELVATAARNHELVIRSTSDYAVVKVLKTQSEQISVLDWSSDSKKLATGADDGDIEVFDVTSGASEALLTGHTGRLLSIKWSPDDKRLISGGRDGIVRVWNSDKATLEDSLMLQVFQIVDVGWSPDGKEFLVNGSNGRLWINRPERTVAAASLSEHTGMASSVAWHPTQRVIAYGGDDRQLHIVSLETDKTSKKLAGHTGKINAVCWSPRGQWIATGASDATVRIWATDTFKTIAVLDQLEGDVNALSWSPDGKQLAMGLGNPNAWAFSTSSNAISRGIVVLDMSNPAKPTVKHALTAHRSVLALAWNATSDRLATGGINARSDNERIRIWDTVIGTEIQKLTLPLETIHSLQWTPDGKTIVAGTQGSLLQGTIKFLSVEDGSTLTTLESQDTVFCVALNRDGTRVLAANKDRTVKLWDIESKSEVLTISTSSSAVHSIAWSSDETQIAAVGAELAIYDAYASYLDEHSPELLDTLTARESTTGLNPVELRARADLHSLQNNWDAAAADLQTLNDASDQPNKWFVMPWRIQGPFDGPMGRREPLEQTPDPFAADPEDLPGPLTDWLPIRLKADGMLNMAAFTGGAESCSCFAISRIYSFEDQQAAFLMGTDDSHRIWLNGALIDEFIGNRPAQPDQDVATAQLKKGWNTILFKVHTGFGGHGFYFRITDQPLQIARALNRKGQFQEALVAWDKLIADHPKETSFLAPRLQAALGAGLHERASEDIVTLSKLVPDNIHLQIIRSDVATARNNFNEAIEALSMAIERSGGSPEHLIRRGELNRLVGNDEQAAEDLAQSIATNTTVSGGFSRTSDSRLVGRIVNAVDQVELVKSGRNATVPWRYTFSAPRGAWTELKFDDTDWQTGLSPFAARSFRKTLWPTDHEQIWIRHEFTLDKVPEGKLLVNAFIDNAAVIYLNGVRIAEGRSVGNQRQNLRPAIQASSPLKPGKNVLAVTGQNTVSNTGAAIDVALSIKNSNSEAVVDILDRAQTAAPQDGAIAIIRGKQLVLNQRWAEASEAYRKGTESVADDHWSWYESIGVEWLLGNNTAMQGQVDKIISQFHDDPNATIARRVVNRAIYPDLVKYDSAVIDKLVDRFQTKAPNNAFTPLIHGVVLFRKGDYSAAEEQFARAKELGTNFNWVFHGFRRVFLSRMAYRQDNFDHALKEFGVINRFFDLLGPKSHKTKLNNTWIDRMAVMLLMAEAGDEIRLVLDGKDLTVTQRRLGIQALLAVARRHRFARQHNKFLEATRQALAELVSLVGDHKMHTDHQKALFLVWQQLNAEPAFQLPPAEVYDALETLFPSSSLSLPRVEWTRLTPIDLQFRNEVESSIESDKSIYVGGPNPQQNVYTIRYEIPRGEITGMRLELVRDRRLPGFGPGRHAFGNVRIHNVEFRLHTDADASGLPIKIAGATSTFHSYDRFGENYATRMFDDDSNSYWDLWPKMGRNHAIVAQFDKPVVSTTGTQLGLTIECTSPLFARRTVGRFHLSATTSTTKLPIQRCWGDPSPQSVSYWSIMATRLMNANQFDKAKPWVERALNDSEPPTVFDWLVAARYHRQSGNKVQADHLYQDALDWASNYAPGQPILERQLQLAASRD